VNLARARLQGTPRRAADEEDVALSAFDSFCRGAAQGRYPKLRDRNDLWKLLFLITERKAYDLAHHARRKKRDWRRECHPFGAAGGGDSAESGSFFLESPGREPDPEFAAQVAEECRRLLGLLGDDMLRTITLRKMEGCTNEEVAGHLGCAVATVERRLRLIRKLWEKERVS
jgi:DNA-directed RNA polymerase specialized sigma24 family protein